MRNILNLAGVIGLTCLLAAPASAVPVRISDIDAAATDSLTLGNGLTLTYSEFFGGNGNGNLATTGSGNAFGTALNIGQFSDGNGSEWLNFAGIRVNIDSPTSVDGLTIGDIDGAPIRDQAAVFAYNGPTLVGVTYSGIGGQLGSFNLPLSSPVVTPGLNPADLDTIRRISGTNNNFDPDAACCVFDVAFDSDITDFYVIFGTPGDLQTSRNIFILDADDQLDIGPAVAAPVPAPATLLLLLTSLFGVRKLSARRDK